MKRIAFLGALLIDGTGSDPVDNSIVLVEDKKIVFAGTKKDMESKGITLVAGSNSSSKISSDNDSEKQEVEIIYVSGKTIMPGIIDTHLHYSGNLSDNDSEWIIEPLMQKAVVAVAQAREALENGLTSVGEISRFGPYIRDMIEKEVIPGPRTVTTGLGFCRTAGHGDSHRLPLDYNEESHPWAERVDGPWELRKAIRKRIRENPDAVKIWSTGGGIWRHDKKADSHYTFEEIKAVVDESNMVGLPVWSHAEGYDGALDSCKAGVSAIIHGQELNEECLALMKEKDITFCPTLQFFFEWFSVYEPPYRPVHDNYPGNTTAEKELNRIIGNLINARDQGVRITVGSDSFCSTLTPYGKYAITEMYALNKAGLTNMETLVAATKNGAEMLKIDDITGTLEAGKYADLLVIDGNPMEDIKAVATENMRIIMKEGKFVKRQGNL